MKLYLFITSDFVIIIMLVYFQIKFINYYAQGTNCSFTRNIIVANQNQNALLLDEVEYRVFLVFHNSY